jgi:hypothetical protein
MTAIIHFFIALAGYSLQPRLSGVHVCQHYASFASRFCVVETVMPKLEQRDIIGKHVNGRESFRDPVVHSVSSTFI